VDGSREALQEGRLGILVDPDSREEVVAAISEVLSRPPTTRIKPASIDEFSEERFQVSVHAWLELLTAPLLQDQHQTAARLNRIGAP
jgi:glycosyltransferase involved in cell wall biosynthesis